MQANTAVPLFLVRSIHSVCYRHADMMQKVPKIVQKECEW